jgi:hypothetical protein
LTSLFIDSIHQSVATNDRCIQLHEKWKRENRSNGNQEKSKEGRKEETLRAFNKSKTMGTLKSVP